MIRLFKFIFTIAILLQTTFVNAMVVDEPPYKYLQYLIDTHKYGQALKLSTSEIRRNKAHTIEYATLLFFQGQSYEGMMKFEDAWQKYSEALEQVKRLGKEYLSTQYEIAYCMTELAIKIDNMSRYDILELQKIEKSILDEYVEYITNINLNSEDILLDSVDRYKWRDGYHRALCLYAWGAIFTTEENINNVISLQNSATKLFGRVSNEYGIATVLLGKCYEAVFNGEEALKQYGVALDVYANLYGEESIEYANILFNIGQLKVSLGEYDSAFRILQPLANLYKGYNVIHPNLATIKELNAVIYAAKGELDEALEELKNANKYFCQLYGHTSPQTLNNILRQAEIYLAKCEYNEVVKLSEYIDNHHENVHIENYIDVMYLDIRLCMATGQYYLSNAMLVYLIEEFSDFVVMSNKRLNIYHDVALCSLLAGDLDLAYNYYIRYMEYMRNEMKQSFVYMSEDQREQFWHKQNETLNQVLCLNHERPSFNSEVGIVSPTMTQWDDKAVILYDAAIIQKGILLEASRNIIDAIAESGDENLINKYNRLREIKMLVSTHKVGDIDALNEEIANIEHELITSVRQVDNHLKYLNIDWCDVRDALGDKDVAIEFICSEDNGRMYYSAEILRSYYDQPRHVSLFSLDKNKSLYFDLTEPDLLLWPKILPFLEDATNIYFAASGDLHKLSVEYLKIDDINRMNDLFNIHRLSSTRYLAQDRINYNIASASLWGGMNYNLDAEYMEYYAEIGAKEESVSRAMSQTVDKLSMWNYLPGTKQEVENIVYILNDGDIQTNVYIGDEGVEETFKMQSSNSSDLLHVATHGFYIAEQEKPNTKFSGFNYMGKDRSMTDSGLIFSGANNVLLDGVTISDSIDDGILTSAEIASMDLRNTNIVVLSACQTGQGEITGEGVFGLQRAFKKAGVDTILMSLQNVDDNATKTLMTSFYAHLIEGKSKSEALYLAQRVVMNSKFYAPDGREYSGADPKYWAPFILLD